MIIMSALEQINTLSWDFIVTTVCKKTCCNTLTHYSDSEQTSLCSFSLLLHAQQRSNKYHFYSLWFYLTGSRTHNLPHWRRARKPLHYQCCLDDNDDRPITQYDHKMFMAFMALMVKIRTDSGFLIRQFWPIYQFKFLVMSIILNESMDQSYISKWETPKNYFCYLIQI